MYATKGQVLMLSGIDSEIMDEISDLMPVDATGDGIIVMESQDFFNYDGLDASDALIYLVGTVIKKHGIEYDLITIRR